MDIKRPFETQNPIRRSLLYMLIPIGMAVLSGALITVMKWDGNIIPAVQESFFGVAFVVALVIAKKEGGPLRNVGFQSCRNVDKWVIVAIVLPLLIYPVNFKNGLHPDISVNYVLSYLSFAIMTGFTEETIFRGLIYRTLRYKGLGYAILWSSFIYSIYYYR